MFLFLLLFVAICTTDGKFVDIGGNECKFHFSELYRPLEWSNGPVGMTSTEECAYIGLSLPDGCTDTKRTNINQYAVVILSVTPNIMEGIAYFKFEGEAEKCEGPPKKRIRCKRYNPHVFRPIYHFSNSNCQYDKDYFFENYKRVLTHKERWTSTCKTRKEVGSAAVFLLIDRSKKHGEESFLEKLQKLVRTRQMTQNTLTRDNFLSFFDRIIDVVVVLSNETPVDNYPSLEWLFPHGVPQLIIPKEVIEGQSSMSRCIRKPVNGYKEADKIKFEEVTTKYSMPLWSLSMKLPRESIIPQCLITGKIPIHLLDVQLKEYIDATFRPVSSVPPPTVPPKRKIPVRKHKGRTSYQGGYVVSHNPQGFYEAVPANEMENDDDGVDGEDFDAPQQPADEYTATTTVTPPTTEHSVVDSFKDVAPSIGESYFAQNSNRDSFPQCNSDTVLKQVRKEMEELRKYVGAIVSQSQKKEDGLDAVKRYGFRKRGFRTYDEANELRTLCETYFSPIGDMRARCENMVKKNFYYLEAFIDPNDILLSKVRSSVDNAGSESPTMNCKLFDASSYIGDPNEVVPRDPDDLPEYEEENQRRSKVQDDNEVEEDDEDEDEDDDEGEEQEEGKEEEGIEHDPEDKENDAILGEEKSDSEESDENEDDEDDDDEDNDKMNENQQSRRKRSSGRDEDEGMELSNDEDEGMELSNDEDEGMELSNDEDEEIVNSFLEDADFGTYRSVLEKLMKPHIVIDHQIPDNDPSKGRISYRQGLCMSVFPRTDKGYAQFLSRLYRLRMSVRHKMVQKIAYKEVMSEITMVTFGDTEYTLTHKFTSTVYHSLKYSISALQTQHNLILQQVNGAVIGSNHYSRYSFHRMATAISEQFFYDLANYVASPDVIGFSLLIDGSQDKAQIGVANIQIRILIDDYPTTMHWELVEKEGDKGYDYMKAVITSINSATDVLNKPGRPFMKIFTTKLISTTSDGASYMVGTFADYLSKFREAFGTRSSQISFPYTWCRAHFMETVLTNMSKNEETIKLAISILRSLRLLFSTEKYGHTRKMWRSLSKNINGVEYAFGAVYKARWVSSMRNLLHRMMQQYGSILFLLKQHVLRSEHQKTELTPGVQSRAYALFHVMSDVRVYLRMNALFNIMDHFVETSLQLQEEAGLMADAEFVLLNTFHQLDNKYNQLMDRNFGTKSRNYFGFQCFEFGKVRKCPDDFINNVFRKSPTTIRGVIELTKNQRDNGNEDVIKIMKNYIVELRNPGEPIGDWSNALLQGYEQEVAEDVDYTSPEEIDKLLEEFLSFNYDDKNLKSMKKNPLILLYKSIKFDSHKGFRTELFNKIKDKEIEQMTKVETQEQHYYAASKDVIVDIVRCQYVFHIDADTDDLCDWEKRKDHPFYEPKSGKGSDYLRHQTILNSLKFFADNLRLDEFQIYEDYAFFTEEVNPNLQSLNIPATEDLVLAILKSRNMKKINKISGAIIIQTLLKYSQELHIPPSIVTLLRYSMIPSPTTSSVERAFSHLNFFKSVTSTRMKISMENARLRVITNGPPINLFDPHQSSMRFLKDGRHKNLPVVRDERRNGITSMRQEMFDPYSTRTVLLKPGSTDVTYVDKNKRPKVKDLSWVHRINAVRKLNN